MYSIFNLLYHRKVINLSKEDKIRIKNNIISEIIIDILILKLEKDVELKSQNTKSTIEFISIYNIYTLYSHIFHSFDKKHIISHYLPKDYVLYPYQDLQEVNKLSCLLTTTTTTSSHRITTDTIHSSEINSSETEEEEEEIKIKKIIYNKESKENKKNKKEMDILLFESIDDFNDILRLFYTIIKNKSKKIGNYNWHIKNNFYGNEMKEFKLNSPLFYIEIQPNILEMERQTNIIHNKLMNIITNNIYFSPSIEEINRLQQNFMISKEMEEEEEEEGKKRKNIQCDFFLFNTSELKNEKDVELIRDILYSDLFNTSILRERNNFFFEKKISLYFTGCNKRNVKNFDMIYFHKEVCFVS
jgi:hypothetical protein